MTLWFQFTDVDICGTAMKPLYVTDFKCLGNTDLFEEEEEMNSRIREARLSFLSGHASLSWYGMTWAAGYLYMLASTHPRFTLPIGLAQVGLKSSQSLIDSLTESVAKQKRVQFYSGLRVSLG